MVRRRGRLLRCCCRPSTASPAKEVQPTHVRHMADECVPTSSKTVLHMQVVTQESIQVTLVSPEDIRGHGNQEASAEMARAADDFFRDKAVRSTGEVGTDPQADLDIDIQGGHPRLRITVPTEQTSTVAPSPMSSCYGCAGAASSISSLSTPSPLRSGSRFSPQSGSAATELQTAILEVSTFSNPLAFSGEDLAEFEDSAAGVHMVTDPRQKYAPSVTSPDHGTAACRSTEGSSEGSSGRPPAELEESGVGLLGSPTRDFDLYEVTGASAVAAAEEETATEADEQSLSFSQPRDRGNAEPIAAHHEESQQSAGVFPLWTYLEADVPLAPIHRFTSAVAKARPDGSSGSGCSTPVSQCSSCSTSSPDSKFVPAAGLRQSMNLAASMVRQSWDPCQFGSPERKKITKVPVLRLSAVGSLQHQSSPGLSSLAPRPHHAPRGSPTCDTVAEADVHSDEQSWSDSDDENYSHETPSMESPAEGQTFDPQMLRGQSPLADVTSRMNSGNSSPCSAVASPLAWRGSGRQNVSPQSSTGTTKSDRLTAAAQARLHSLKGTAAMVSSINPPRGRRSRSLTPLQTEDEAADQVSQFFEVRPEEGSQTSQPESAAAVIVANSAQRTCRTRYQLQIDDVRESLVEVALPTPAIQECQTPAAAMAAEHAYFANVLENVQETKPLDEAELLTLHNNMTFSEAASRSDAEGDLGHRGLGDPAPSEEPVVPRGNVFQSARISHALSSVRKEVTCRDGAMEHIDGTPTGFSNYENNTFQAQAQAQVQGGKTSAHLEGSPRSPRATGCSQALSSLSDAANTSESGAGAEVRSATLQVHQVEQPPCPSSLEEKADSAVATDIGPQAIVPLVNKPPAPVGLTPRFEHNTPRTAAAAMGMMPGMTPRTYSAMDGMLRNTSIGATFDVLKNGDGRSREAAAAALYRMAQQECHKMAMCRTSGGLEALSSAVNTMKGAAGRQAAASALCALCTHAGCRGVVADRVGVHVFVTLTASSLAEDQVLAARGLGYLATLDPKRSQIIDSGGAYALVCLLEAKQSRVREAAARALWSLAHTSEECRVAIGDAGGIPVLLEMSKADAARESAAAAGAIWNLAASTSNQRLIADSQGVPTMLALFQEQGNPLAQLAAAGAICNLLLLPSNLRLMLQAGVARSLVECLEQGPPADMKASVARAVYILARDPEGCEAILKSEGCQPLVVEVAHCNEMAAWSLKELLQHDGSVQAIRQVGGLQALVSLLRHPSATASGLEAAAWAVKILVDAHPSVSGGTVSDLLSCGGPQALLHCAVANKIASQLAKEGALRSLWNLVNKDKRVAEHLAVPATTRDLLAVLSEEASLDLRGAVAGLLWNLLGHGSVREDIVAAGGIPAFVRLLQESLLDNAAGDIAVKALCSLSGDLSCADRMAKAGCAKAICDKVTGAKLKSTTEATANAALVTLYNCVTSSVNDEEECTEATAHCAVAIFVDAIRDGGASTRSIGLKVLRGLSAQRRMCSAVVASGAVDALANGISSVFVRHRNADPPGALPFPLQFSKSDAATAIWVIESLAFHESGRDSILRHAVLLAAIVRILGSGGPDDIRSAAVRIVHNLVACQPATDSPLPGVEGLLQGLMAVAGDSTVLAATRESATWSIKAMTVAEGARERLIRADGVLVMSTVLGDAGCTSSTHQAAALVLRNLATSLDAFQHLPDSTCHSIVMRLLSLVTADKTDCQSAAAGALANLSSFQSVKRAIVEAGGAQALVSCLGSESCEARQAAARAMANMAYHDSGAADAIVAAGGGPALQRMINSKDHNQAQMDIACAALAISNVSAHPPARRHMVESGLPGSIVATLQALQEDLEGNSVPTNVGMSSTPVEACVRAVWGLAPQWEAVEQMVSGGVVGILLGIVNRCGPDGSRSHVVAACRGAARVLSSSDANREAMVSCGAPDHIIEVLRSAPSSEGAELAALALWDLAVSTETAQAVGSAGGVSALIGLLTSPRAPNRLAAIGALHNLAFLDSNKDIIVQLNGVEILVGLLTPQTPESNTIAAQTLKLLALQPDYKVRIAEAGGIGALARLLTADCQSSRDAAAGALRNLATNKLNKVAIVEAGALPHLVSILDSSDDDGPHAAAVGALCNLAFNSTPAVKEAIVSAGSVPLLVSSLAVSDHSGADAAVTCELAARALWNLASCSSSTREAIAQAGGLVACVNLMRVGPPKTRSVAAGALSHLAIDTPLKDAIRLAGGIPVLVRLASSGSSTEGFVAAASVLKNLAVMPANKDELAEAGGITAFLAMMWSGTAEERTASRGILRNLAFNSPAHAAIILQEAGTSDTLEQLLAPK